jgi:lambda family phage portal protein
MDDIKEIDESERVASRVAAAMAAFIKKGTPDLYMAPELDSDGTPKYRELEMVPGIIFDDLMPGEDIGTFDPKRPNQNLIPFRDSQLRSAASGLMTSYSSLSKNYNGTYSAQRQELVEQFNVYRALSNSFIFRWCQPTWESFVDAAVASGAVSISSRINRDTLYNASHTAPPMPWIDPEAEVTAFAMAEDRLYESKSAIIRRRGGVPDEVFREIQRDREELERRGLTAASPNTETSQNEPPPDDDSSEETANRTARAVLRLQRRRA